MIGLALAAAPASADTPRYQFTDLSAIDPVTFDGYRSEAYSINNKGQVVGYATHELRGPYRLYDWFNHTWCQEEITIVEQINQAFVYDNGKMINLGQRGETSNACGINDSGRIVGAVGRADNTERAFRLIYGPLNETGNSKAFVDPSIQGTRGLKINNQNQILVHNDSGGTFYYENNSLHDIGPLLGTPGRMTDINNNGLIVGSSEAQNTYGYHATSYDIRTGAVTDLGTLATTPTRQEHGYTRWYSSYARGVNDANEIVGASEIDQQADGLVHTRAFLYKNGVMQDLGALPGVYDSVAMAINNVSQVVGYSRRGGFLYSDGVMYDLNEITEGIPAGWNIELTSDINDLGQIVGYARDCNANLDVTHAILLSPIAPTTPKLMASQLMSASQMSESLAVSEFDAFAGTFSPAYVSEPLDEPVRVPEPGTAGLILMAAAGVLRRRRS